MDYNDIKSRLQRTLTSLNARFNDDIWSHANYHHYQNGNEQRVSITWGTQDENKVIGPIMSILHNLASLKDNLKNSLTQKGLDPKIVETEIDSCLHLQLLIDIINQEKHGSPLKKYRSPKKPIITDASQSLRMASRVRDNEGNIISNDGPPAMQIDAKIRDEHGKIICYLDDLVETCYEKWISIIKNNHLVES